GEVEPGAQEPELHAPGLPERDEGPQRVPLVDDLVERLNWVAHRSRRAARPKLTPPSSSAAPGTSTPPAGSSPPRPTHRKRFPMSYRLARSASPRNAAENAASVALR